MRICLDQALSHDLKLLTTRDIAPEGNALSCSVYRTRDYLYTILLRLWYGAADAHLI